MKGRRRTTIFRPGLMSNLIIYYKLINYKCMDNIMKCTPLGEQKSLWLRKTLLIMKFFVLFLLLGTVPCWAGIAYSQNVKMSLDMENTTVHDVINAIEKKGEGIHHIAFKTNDIAGNISQAKEAGLTVLNDPPVPGAHNTQVTFLHPKCTFGVLTEFCQHPGGCECGK